MIDPATTKQEAVDQITELIGHPKLQVGKGSTEPKEVLTAVVEHFGLPLDLRDSKPALGAGIARAAGLDWDPTCDSTHSASGGGSTVTLEGLNRVLAAVHLLRAGDLAAELASTAIEPDDEPAALEGRRRLRQHWIRERRPSLVKQKKAQTLAREAVLRCEVCQFAFPDLYGELGGEFIECHHTVPLSMLSPGQPTRLADLALVCANCHRMLHRGGTVRSIAELRRIVRSIRGQEGCG